MQGISKELEEAKGMAEYILCDEKDLVELPKGLRYTDEAQGGFGTVYKAIPIKGNI
jgi:hypothetical protein